MDTKETDLRKWCIKEAITTICSGMIMTAETAHTDDGKKPSVLDIAKEYYEWISPTKTTNQ